MIVRDENTATDALAIVEKYEAFVTYLYPILQNAPRRHGVLRDAVLAALFVPIGGLYHAAKSKQVSRLYAVDAEFATLRAFLRFLSQGGIRIVSPRQHEICLKLLAEPGRMLNAWLKKLKASDASARPMGQAAPSTSRPGSTIAGCSTARTSPIPRAIMRMSPICIASARRPPAAGSMANFMTDFQPGEQAMAFERLEVRAASGKKGMPASMSLSCHGGSSRPAAIVALSGALVGEAGYTSKSRFNVLIGTEDDKGRLRIVAEKDGIIEARPLKGGAFFLNLGYVPLIGVEPARKRPTEASVISPGTVEVAIPDFDMDEDEETRRPKLLPAPDLKKPAAAAAGGGRPKIGERRCHFSRRYHRSDRGRRERFLQGQVDRGYRAPGQAGAAAGAAAAVAGRRILPDCRTLGRQAAVDGGRPAPDHGIRSAEGPLADRAQSQPGQGRRVPAERPLAG
jgi:hypothetical protein